MCPEPDFGWTYRSLIASYRLAPELSARQLDAILARFYAARERPKPQQSHEERGRVPI